MSQDRPYQRESQMYPFVVEWFGRTLRGLYPRADIQVFDTSRYSLLRFLERQGLHRHFQHYSTYDIHVDVTAVMIPRTGKALLGFVECKLDQISLRDLSQLLGYSRVALPVYSIITSPEGIGPVLHSLLNGLNRLDVLEYDRGRRLKLGTWDASRREVSLPTLIPQGDYS